MRLRFARATSTAILALGVLVGVAARADLYRWDFTISEDQVKNNAESPDGSTDSPATGWGHFAFDTETETLHYTITWENLVGELTKLHVHGPADADSSNPGHLFEIFNSVGEIPDEIRTTGQVTGSVTMDADAAACTDDPGDTTDAGAGAFPCFVQELAYVNVHTTEYPVGEIRGNLVSTPPLLVWSFESTEDQVNNNPESSDGSTDSPATGLDTLRYDLDGGMLHYRIGWSDLQDDLIKLHVHGPATAETSNANHLFEIWNSVGEIPAEIDLREDAWEGSIAMDAMATECNEQAGGTEQAAPSSLPCFLEGRAYVNVHTKEFVMGEIRGNLRLVPHPYEWSFRMSEDQVNNNPESEDGSTGSPGTGTGHLVYDAYTGVLAYTLAWDGLQSDLIKLHFHGPADPDESSPNHPFEIWNTVDEILRAGVDRRSDSWSNVVLLDRSAPRCSDDPGTRSVPAPGTLACFLEQRAYVNVHTTDFPVGEIRGNLRLVPEPDALWLGLAALGGLGALRRQRRAPR